jgi:hypothetical protein
LGEITGGFWSGVRLFLEGALSKWINSSFWQWLIFGVFSGCSHELLHAFDKTPNIGHAPTTGLESAGKKWPNTTVPEIIENLPQELKFIAISRRCSLDLRNTGCMGELP